MTAAIIEWNASSTRGDDHADEIPPQASSGRRHSAVEALRRDVRLAAEPPESVVLQPCFGARCGSDRPVRRAGAGTSADAHCTADCNTAEEEPAGRIADDALHQPAHDRAALRARVWLWRLAAR